MKKEGNLNGLKKYNRQYCSGSSLLESVIAITIIATCLLIAIQLYVVVLNSSESINSYRIRFRINDLYNEMKKTQDFNNEDFDYKTYTVKKRVEDFKGDKDLKKIKYIVQTVSDTVVYKYIMSKKEEDD